MIVLPVYFRLIRVAYLASALAIVTLSTKIFQARLLKLEFKVDTLETALQLYSKGNTLPVSFAMASNMSLPLEKTGDAS